MNVPRERGRRRSLIASPNGEHITKVLLSSADGDEDLHRQLHRAVGRLSQRRSFRRQPARSRGLVGFSLLKQDGWVDPVAPGTRLEILVSHPATTPSVSLAQLRR
jgi:hypothetical protein